MLTLAASVAVTQEMPRHVFGSGGGSHQVAALHVSWTIGQAEPIATTTQPTVILNSGFQQDDDFMVSTWEHPQENVIQVYPNPCTDRIHLATQVTAETTLGYHLYGSDGKKVAEKDFPLQSGSLHEIIDMSGVPPGVYNLVIRKKGSTSEKGSFKIIKQ